MTIATVVSLSGQAWARDAEGNLRELRVGDALQEGETLVTADNARVELDFGDNLDPTLIEGGQQIAMTPDLDADQPVAAEDASALDEDLEALLAALEDEEGDLLDIFDATAAGAGPGGGGGDGHNFVRLARIAEDTDPLAFDFSVGQFDGPPEGGAPSLLAEVEEPEQEQEPPVEEPEIVDAIPEAGASGAELFDAQLLEEGGSVSSGTLDFDFGDDGAGSIGFAGMDGTSGVVGTETVTYGWDAGSNTLTATGPRGDLFTIQVNPTTGEYTLTLLDNVLHAEGADDAGTELTFTVIDGNGTEATGSLSITFFDDAPEAVDDSAAIDEDAAAPLTGNVLSNDTQGADATSVAFASTAAQYGSFTDNGDGTWSYTLDNSLAAVQALDDGETLTETFTYTLTDADGDTSTATLTITINGQTDGPPVIDIDDADGEVTGADNSVVEGTGDTVTGTMSVSAEAGIATVTVGGQDVTNASTTPVVIAAANGTLTVTGYDAATGEISYAYTENAAAADHSAGDSSVVDSFTVSVTDVAGVTTSDSLDIQIIDTAPEAVDDSAAIDEDAAAPLTGNVLSNDTQGADATSVAFASTAAQYGSFTDNGDGTWSYTLDNSLAAVQALDDGETLTETFDYTLTDADGDTSTATLTITINGATDTAGVTVSAEGADSTVYEAGLVNGSNADSDSETDTGSFQVSASDGIASVTVGGQTFTLAQLQALSASSPSAVIDTGEGMLQLTGYDSPDGNKTATIEYTYTLKAAQTHEQPDDDTSLADTVALQVDGVGGSSATGTLTIDIIDDVPSITSHNLAIANLAGVYEGVYDFNVGADDQAFSASFGEGALIWTGMPEGYELKVNEGASTSTSITYTASSGSFEFFHLTLNADGTYAFELVSPAPVVETEVESLLSSFDANNFYTSDGKTAYLFTSDVFDGKFSLAATAYRGGKLEDISLSSTDLGVKSNVVQGKHDEKLRFDVQPVEGGVVSLSSLVFSVSGTGGSSAGDRATLSVYDVNGVLTTYEASLSASDGEFAFEIDPTIDIDYMELSPKGDNSFKIDGVSTSYITQIFPDDYQLDFELSGSDFDGDAAATEFSVFVKTMEDGSYEISGADGDDVVHGTDGADVIIGGAGNDILYGGLGDDVFQWNFGDQGEEEAAATDVVKDFGEGQNVLDLADLLQGEESSNINDFIFAEQDGDNTTLYIKHDGGLGAGGANADQKIVLENHDMGDLSSEDFIQQLLSNDQLNIDQ